MMGREELDCRRGRQHWLELQVKVTLVGSLAAPDHRLGPWRRLSLVRSEGGIQPPRRSWRVSRWELFRGRYPVSVGSRGIMNANVHDPAWLDGRRCKIENFCGPSTTEGLTRVPAVRERHHVTTKAMSPIASKGCLFPTAQAGEGREREGGVGDAVGGPRNWMMRKNRVFAVLQNESISADSHYIIIWKRVLRGSKNAIQ